MANIDAEIAAAKSEISKYTQARRQQGVFKRKSGKTCPIFGALKTAGFSDIVSDNVCKMAAKYNIPFDRNITKLLNAIKNVAEIRTISKTNN